jgi:energy-coupling factor transporter transmembrane protein EcfT
MNNVKPLIFLIPVIALTLVVLMFIYLLKKADDKDVFKRFVFITLVLAFLLNFAWEVIQLPLYKNVSHDLEHIAFCALASVADAIMVLFLYFCLRKGMCITCALICVWQSVP